MRRIPYTTEIERDQIISEQIALGFRIEGEFNLITGNILLFDDNVPLINSNRQYQSVLKTDAFLQKLTNADFAAIDTWVDNNVGNMNQARTLFKKMLMVMSYLLNKQS